MPACPICNKVFPSSNEFTSHVQNCASSNEPISVSNSPVATVSPPPANANNNNTELGQCPMCQKMFPLTEIETHIDSHLAEDAANDDNNDNKTRTINNNSNNNKPLSKACPMCNKQVPINELDAHVNSHLDSGTMMRWQSSGNDDDQQPPNNNNNNNNNTGGGVPPLPDGASRARPVLAKQTGDWQCPYCSVMIPVELRDLHLKAHNKRPESMSRESSLAPTPSHNNRSTANFHAANNNTSSSNSASGTTSGTFTATNSNTNMMMMTSPPAQRGGGARTNQDSSVVIQLQCPICKKIIPETNLEDHMSIHDFKGDGSNKNSAISLDEPPRHQPEETKSCPLCFKQVRSSLYEWHVQSCGVEVTIECQVCWDDVPLQEAFSFTCPGTHKVCRECAGRLLEISVNESKLAACPVGDCRSTVSSLDVAAFFGGQNSEMAKKYAQIELKTALDSTNAVMTCATPNCPNQVLLDPEAKDRATCFRCNMCKNSTCTLCRSQPFHYRFDCDGARRCRANWLSVLHDIVGTGKGTDGKPTNLALELREKAERYKELQADEQLKERTCKLCSSCGRVIERTSGCDSMRCGRDSAGGNIQDGCGVVLNWAKLQPYKAKLPTPVQNQAGVRKELLSCAVHSEFDRCVLCKKQIAGPRFLCANCPEEESFCLKCIPRYIETRHRQHFFQLIVAD